MCIFPCVPTLFLSAEFHTDFQTAGKGRRGRSWNSPAGSNLYFSLLLKPDFAPDKASMLTLVAAMAVEKALLNLQAECKIKWPNDIVLNKKKISGILCEMSAEKNLLQYCICGIGIMSVPMRNHGCRKGCMTSSTESACRRQTKAEKGLRIIYSSGKTMKRSSPVSFRMARTFM